MRKIPFEILNFFGFILLFGATTLGKKSTNRREFRSDIPLFFQPMRKIEMNRLETI